MSWKEERGELVFTVSGEVDHHGAKGLMKELDRTLENHILRQFVMDLSGVSFMDSSGIALLLRLHRRAAAAPANGLAAPGSHSKSGSPPD